VLSVVAHGLSAHPLISRLFAGKAGTGSGQLETGGTSN